MLKPLRGMVRDWMPTHLRALDPLVSILGAWEGIVGRDVAQNARPQQLVAATLLVTTTSSAWSQQLAFLEPQILTALQALPEVCRVNRLRFRVGRIRPAGRAPQPAAHRPSTVPADGVTSCDPDPMVRLRERLAYRRGAAAHLCQACGVVLDDGVRCAPCGFDERRRRVRIAQRLMYETPWLGFELIAAAAGGLASSEYEEIRRDLLRRWREVLTRAERTGRIRPDGFERRIASSYLLLQSGLEPDHISRTAVRNLLGDPLEALLFGASESPPQSRMSVKS